MTSLAKELESGDRGTWVLNPRHLASKPRGIVSRRHAAEIDPKKPGRRLVRTIEACRARPVRHALVETNLTALHPFH